MKARDYLCGFINKHICETEEAVCRVALQQGDSGLGSGSGQVLEQERPVLQSWHCPCCWILDQVSLRLGKSLKIRMKFALQKQRQKYEAHRSLSPTAQILIDQEKKWMTHDPPAHLLFLSVTFFTAVLSLPQFWLLLFPFFPPLVYNYSSSSLKKQSNHNLLQ